jgi:uncharacterized OB-fold protein
MAEKRPNRVRGPGHDDFWSYTADDELRIQRCQTCTHLSWPPVEQACEMCGGTDLSWEKLSGRGKVISWCTFHQKYYPDAELPYDAILVELDEGPIVISNPDGFTNDEVTYDTPVTVAFVDCEDDAGAFRLPVFQRT